jgi:hypothetical protein
VEGSPEYLGVLVPYWPVKDVVVSRRCGTWLMREVSQSRKI